MEGKLFTLPLPEKTDLQRKISIFDLPEGGDEISRTFAAHLYLEYHLHKKLSSCSIYTKQKQTRGSPTFDPLLLDTMKLYDPLDLNLTEFKIEMRKMPHINVGDSRNMTLLHGLCLLGSLEMIKSAVGAGAEVKDCDIDDYNCLHYCAMSDRADLFEYIMSLDRGLVKKDTSRGQRLPVHIAAICGSVGVLRVILERYPGMLYIPDQDGRTPLWLATYYRHGTAAELLLHKSEYTYRESSEPELSFLLRLGTRINPLARKLLDRSVVKCPERNKNYYWLEDTDLINREAVAAGKTSLDPGLLLASVGEENKASSMTKLLDHPVIYNNLLFKWKHSARFLFFLYVVLKWVYIFLWTAIYSLDSSYSLVLNQSTRLKYCLLLNLGVVIFILVFDYGRIFSSIVSVRRYRNHERKIAKSESLKVHPKMWNVTFSRKYTMEKDTELGSRWNFLSCGLDRREISKFALAEHIVDIISVVLLLYLMVVTFSDTNRVKDTGSNSNGNYTKDSVVLRNEPRDYLISILLVLQWFIGMSTFRVFETFGYLLEVLQGIILDICKVGVFWFAIYIPLFAIFWETIYSWEIDDGKSSTNLTTQVLETLRYTFFETFRKTHGVYNYDLGLQLTRDKAEKYSIDQMELWWYFLHFYWVVLGAVVLVNMLISLMGITTNKAQEKARSISLYNTMIFTAEIESMIPGWTGKWISEKIRSKEGGMKIMEFPNTEEDLEEKEESDVWNSLEELQRLVESGVLGVVSPTQAK
ncbi:hypothetical protein ACHWQZ_G012656 [Mnemiopsis leidyi]